jgi:hypothetical protein
MPARETAPAARRGTAGTIGADGRARSTVSRSGNTPGSSHQLSGVQPVPARARPRKHVARHRPKISILTRASHGRTGAASATGGLSTISTGSCTGRRSEITAVTVVSAELQTKSVDILSRFRASNQQPSTVRSEMCCRPMLSVGHPIRLASDPRATEASPLAHALRRVGVFPEPPVRHPADRPRIEHHQHHLRVPPGAECEASAKFRDIFRSRFTLASPPSLAALAAAALARRPRRRRPPRRRPPRRPRPPGTPEATVAAAARYACEIDLPDGELQVCVDEIPGRMPRVSDHCKLISHRMTSAAMIIVTTGGCDTSHWG